MSLSLCPPPPPLGYCSPAAATPYSLLIDLSRAIDSMYPLKSAPDRLDDLSLFPHALAGHLLDYGVVKLPIVRYRGFRPEPLPARGAAATGGLVAIASPAADAASAAWRLQQHLEFIPFEERVKRVSTEPESGDAVHEEQNGVEEITAEQEATETTNNHHAGAVGGTTSATGGSMPGAAAAKRLAVVLADYLGDTSTIGMVVVDQPGMGMTTALLKFLEWYCKGEAAGGRQVREAVTYTA